MQILAILILLAGAAYADTVADLEQYAHEVPIAEIDDEAKYYIHNETNESIDGMKSHYTLALYERASDGKQWYILDGYYELKSGVILFLDYIYRPQRQSWSAIQNYRYTPLASERFMLRAEEICNPFRRNFTGLLKASAIAEEALPSIRDYFRRHFGKNPLIVTNGAELYISDLTRGTFFASDPVPLFTLNELGISDSLKRETGIQTEIVSSGRFPSDNSLRQTYVPVTETCRR
jgi:hypothetical protein